MEIPIFGKIQYPFPWLVGLMVAGVLVVGTTSYVVLGKVNNPNVDIEALTVPVTEQNLSLNIQASGTVVPIKSVNISPKSSGRLAQLYVEQGDWVQEGQKLALMENNDLQAQYIQSLANVNQAKAKLAEAQAGTRPEEIQQAKSRLIQARARLAQVQEQNSRQVEQLQTQVLAARSRFELAQSRVERYAYLVEEGAVSRDRYDEAITEYRNAQANLLEAQQRLEQAQNTNPEVLQYTAAVAEAQQVVEQLQRGTRLEVIDQLQAAVDAAQGQVLALQVQLQDSIITAPFSGIITQRYAEEGAFVTPTTSASSTASATSTSIFALANGLKIVARVPEVDIIHIEPGQTVDIVADAYPDEVFQGNVQRVAPEAIIEQNVTSFEVEVALVTGQEELRSRMNVNVTFLGKELADSVVVPTVAIVTENGETGVMILNEENEPEFHPVTIGLTIEDKTQVLKGLKAGEQVFIDLPEGSQD